MQIMHVVGQMCRLLAMRCRSVAEFQIKSLSGYFNKMNTMGIITQRKDGRRFHWKRSIASVTSPVATMTTTRHRHR